MFVFKPGQLKRVEQAMDSVDRKLFVRPEAVKAAYEDHPLPIGYGQTISQPTTVKYMLCWLDVQPGDKVLDVGSGSGWTSAMLAWLVGDQTLVTAVERVSELVAFGQNNCKNAGYSNIQFHHNTNSLGWPDNKPYDRILVSAAANGDIPDAFIEQLAPNGKLVVPVDSSIYEIKINEQSEIAYSHEHYGFIFVPLIPADCQ